MPIHSPHPGRGPNKETKNNRPLTNKHDVGKKQVANADLMTGKLCREEIAYATQKTRNFSFWIFAQLVQIVIHMRAVIFDVAAFD